MKCDKCGLDKPNYVCLGGSVPANEDHTQVRMCPNLVTSLKFQTALKRVHPEARDARVITESPLFTPKLGDLTNPGVDLTTRNVHIQGITWNQFMPHLKLIQLGKNIRIRILTDGDLRDIFVGNRQYKAKPINRRDKEEVINGLGDLREYNDDLVIIRVGFLGSTNKAGPGLLHETLLYRLSDSKPVWIFESSYPDVVWRYTKSAEVENFVNRFAQVFLTSTEPATENLAGLQNDPPEKEAPSEYNSAVPEDDDEVGLPVPEARKTREVSNLEDGDGMGGLLDFTEGKKSKKFGKKGGWD